ncbi:hypothetical protein QMT40_000388 [Parvibaculaceae bacterium PLY_AMNH_Bact1]|nr:hypothetical protein QMT40_000388 [Parvibaculaceae bacterium PLY_AMNH_Bact1]
MPPHTPVRNRYYKGAKLSEYRFLKVLRAFADGDSVRQVSGRTGISERAIRDLFAKFRVKLMEATIHDREAFGGAGMYLYRNGRVSERGRSILESVRNGPNFEAHRTRHALRFRTSKDAAPHVFEMTVRIFCSIHIPKTPEVLYPEKTREALSQLTEIGAFIRTHADNEVFMEKYSDVTERFMTLSANFRKLLDKEELLSLRDKSDMHSHPDNLLYDHLRRYLLRNPL